MRRLHTKSLTATSSFVGLSPLVGAALSVAGVVLLSRGTHRASQVQWECFAGRCGTNDVTSVAPMFGLLALVLGAILLSGVLRTVAAPLATLAASGAVLVGLRGAVNDHLVTSDSVRGWTVAASVLCALSLVLTTIAGVYELKKSSAYWVLLGRASTWGRVRDYEDIDGHRCFGTVHFDDAAGNRYTVRTHVPRESFKRPPRVYYDRRRPGDPSTLRIGMPGQPMTAAKRAEQLPAVRNLLPLPDDV